jgi:hypothetical protein
MHLLHGPPQFTDLFVCRSLSSHALTALAEFHAEKDAYERTFQKLRTGAAPRAGAGLGVVEPEDEDPIAEDVDDQPLSMAAFTEDWNESQFWVRKTRCRKQSTGQICCPVASHLWSRQWRWLLGSASRILHRVMGYLLRTGLALGALGARCAPSDRRQLHDIDNPKQAKLQKP